MGCMCYECRFAVTGKDNHNKLIEICVCRESDNFLKELDLAFDNCEVGEIDDSGDLAEGFRPCL